jgi:MerR family Zn(II)-responsive transcriptional regulator of zntA
MKIGELAYKTGTTPKTLRFYEQIGVLQIPVRTSGGYREYNGDAFIRIQFIKAGQAIGLSLAEVRNLLRIRDEGVSPCTAALVLLDEHLVEIRQRISELTGLKKTITELRAKAASLDASDCPPESVCRIINPPH